ncbi:division/cell wall cluster transcriptional repressor MraZ [Cellulomonas hominis]
MDSTLAGFGSAAPFLGTYTPRLDDKGRLILPAKFRGQLAPGLVMTRGQERCLFLLPLDEFRRMHDQIRQAPVTSKQARDYLRVFLSGASDEVPDKQGRVSIPPMLRTYAGLDRDVAVIGAGTRVEIWDLTAWETYLAAQEAGYAETAEEVFPSGSF